ncbi:uncharacterized protein LOC6575047 isoform X1 [Drosophila mojavensis]|uniref:uncharacterized protein LOC6575047 isoform X1 n=1 Tax=Drosophila mojavensis TaxID=7230 RepID=UPI0013EE43E0|nr:uncharacterized protein LOC6575047 isoform X1 [Drosophila mojavensis]
MRRRQFDKCVKNTMGAKRVRMVHFGLESKCVPLKREANNSAKTQQMQQPNRKQQHPQSAKHAASPQANKELIVHWTRSERQNYEPIRLLPPW